MGRVWEVTCSFPMDTWCDLVCAHNDKENVEDEIAFETTKDYKSFWWNFEHTDEYFCTHPLDPPTNTFCIIPKVWRSTVSYFAVLCWTCKGKSEIGNLSLWIMFKSSFTGRKTLIIKTNRALLHAFAKNFRCWCIHLKSKA